MKNTGLSKKLFHEAQKYLPGGVDSPVRAFKAVGGNPLFIDKARGSHIFDVDGNEFIDYVGSWGPMIAGHAHPQVVEALKIAAEKGTSFGAPNELEIVLARMISEAMPSLEMVRFVNSGTEATMSALRMARAFTGRDKVLKFDGCYHGHSDGLLAKSGSGMATLGIPDSAGVPLSYAQNTLILPYNDINAVRNIFLSYPEDIAAVIIEPVAANMGVVLPKAGFLEGLRKITQEFDALLIFDEVVTGFRVAYGGAQSLYGIMPDITCLGKIIGGGLPVGAYGGRREIMEMIAPAGPVYQAGTLSGNPLAMTAGIETLKILAQPGVYCNLEKKSAYLEQGIKESASAAGIPIQTNRKTSLLTVFFNTSPVENYRSAKQSDKVKFKSFFNGLVNEGIYWPPSQFEAAFISLAHTDRDIEQTIYAISRVLTSLKE